MYIALIFLAALMSTVQFLLNSKYQQNEGTSIIKSLKFSFVMSFYQVVLTFIVSKGEIEFSAFSLLMSTIDAALAIVFYYMSINALANTNLTVYSLFSMLGKMLPPSLFSIAFLGEDLTWQKAVCMALVVISLVIGNPKGKTVDKRNKAWIYYIAVFILSGFVGICEKFHQTSEKAVDTNSFVLLVGAVMFITSGVILLIYKLRGESLKFVSPINSLSCISVYAVICTVSSLVLLYAMIHVDASLQFPLLTGGTIVFSVIMDFVTGKKPKINSIIGASIALAGLVILAL